MRHPSRPHRIRTAGTLPGYHPCCVTLTHPPPLCACHTHTHTPHTTHTHTHHTHKYKSHKYKSHKYATGGADTPNPTQAGQTLTLPLTLPGGADPNPTPNPTQAGQTLADLSFLCAGAGSAGLGVCEQIVDGMVEAGLTKAEARARFVVCTSVGALGKADGTHGERAQRRSSQPHP